MKEQTIQSDLTFSIASKKLKPLFTIESHRHAVALLYNWAIILVTIVFCGQFFTPLSYILGIIIIGARMHALAILMHDATHYRFLKNRKWNDLLSNLLTMYPIFTSIEQYRLNHLRHHRHLNTEEDPDWVAKLGKRAFTFPKSKREFLMSLLSYFFLYQGLMDALWLLKRLSANKPEKKEKAPRNWARASFYLLLFTGLTLTGTWKYFFLFWIIPYLSTFFMFQYIRSVAEHFGELAYENSLNSTRTVKTNWLERFFIAPHNVGYHLEHHLYPGVPFYNLPALHQLLMENEEYNVNAHITQGYLSGLLKELGSVQQLTNA